MKKLFFIVLLGVFFSGVALANSAYDLSKSKSSSSIYAEQWYIYYNKLRYCDRLPYYQASMCRLSAMQYKPR
ncbi:hypothetical protein QJ306_000118 [Campylobacter upsaliensis]|nr:hypothetical protein [Campylobacter upsaliensis]